MKPGVADYLARYSSPAVEQFFEKRSDAMRHAAEANGPYPGDFTKNLPPLHYDTHQDALPDAGEVVWAWVPFDGNREAGKDRPVLVIAREAGTGWLLGLPLSSVEHKSSAQWASIGCGAWDVRGRESFVQLDRIVRVARVRRIGGRVPEATFIAVVSLLKRSKGR